MNNTEPQDMIPGEDANTELNMRQLRAVLPKAFRKNLTPGMLDKVNEIANGVDKDYFRDQMLSYGNLVGRGIGVETLANAIKYVMLTDVHQISNEQAYLMIFPEKAEGRNKSPDASVYNRSKCVSAIRERSIIGAKLVMAPEYFRSMEKLVMLRDGIGARPADKVSPTVQLNSAIALIDALAPAEDQVININHGMTEETKSITQNILDQLGRAGDIQMQRMAAGESLKDVQRLGIQGEAIEAEIE